MHKENRWPNTNLIDLLNIKLPIIQAPMAGGATTAELVAAVSNAGGLGSFAAGYLKPDEIEHAIQRIRQLTDKPFAVNLFIPEKHIASTAQIQKAMKTVEDCCHELNFHIDAINPPYAPNFDDQMQVIVDEKIPIFSFTFGIPSADWIIKLKANSTITVGTATTLQEAKLLEAQQIDMVVAQGREAGGHRGTFLSNPEDALHDLHSLLTLLNANINIPIIAAGGIMTGHDINNALTLGAAGVQMGTAFLCCHESGIHPLYKQILLSTSSDNTTLTRAFSGKLARGIKNKFMVRMTSHKSEILDYPIQNALTTAMRKESAKQNNPDFMAMWAGQSARLCKSISATDLVRALNDELKKN